MQYPLPLSVTQTRSGRTHSASVDVAPASMPFFVQVLISPESSSDQANCDSITTASRQIAPTVSDRSKVNISLSGWLGCRASPSLGEGMSEDDAKSNPAAVGRFGHDRRAFDRLWLDNDHS